jgi:hypothetical protein
MRVEGKRLCMMSWYPGVDLPRSIRKWVPEKGGGCVERNSAGRAPAHDVPARGHREMKLGQAEN